MGGSNADAFVFDPATASIMGNPDPRFMHLSTHLHNVGLYPSTMQQQADSINHQDANGKTQLHQASIDRNVMKAKSLLDAGAAVDIQDHIKNEPLHYAVMAGNLGIVLLLLRFGANVSARGQLGRSPLHLVMTSKSITDALLGENAAVSAQDDNGDTALHLAMPTALGKTPSCSATNTAIDALLQCSADLNLENNDGLTAFHKLLAQEYSQAAWLYMTRFLDAGVSITKNFPDGSSPFKTFSD
jgi:ankyrin repeat protein